MPSLSRICVTCTAAASAASLHAVLTASSSISASVSVTTPSIRISRLAVRSFGTSAFAEICSAAWLYKTASSGSHSTWEAEPAGLVTVRNTSTCPRLICLPTSSLTVCSRNARFLGSRRLRSRNRWFTVFRSTVTSHPFFWIFPLPYPVMLRNFHSSSRRFSKGKQEALWSRL